MIQHPWIELQVTIREKWLTQKAFASVLWKKVSEVNELLKWKRNITIQWDYLLHKTLWTPIKYRILKQVDYEYSLLDTEELDIKSNNSVDNQYLDTQDSTTKKETQEENIIQEPEKTKEETVDLEQTEEKNIKEKNKDIQERAKIFRSF